MNRSELQRFVRFTYVLKSNKTKIKPKQESGFDIKM
jgi:hypothetical protein